MDLNVIITGLVGVFTTIISGWASWFFTRKKYNSEVDQNLIENMYKSLEFYKKLSDDNKARLDDAIKRSEMLEEEVIELRKQLNNLMITLCSDLSCQLRKKEFNKLNIKDQ